MFKLRRALEDFSEFTGTVIAWLTIMMVLLTFSIVVLRYAFNLGWISMQESVTWMHAAVFMLGAAYTLKRDEHVRVDIFYRGMSVRRQAIVDLHLPYGLPVAAACGDLDPAAIGLDGGVWEASLGLRFA